MTYNLTLFLLLIVMLMVKPIMMPTKIASVKSLAGLDSQISPPASTPTTMEKTMTIRNLIPVCSTSAFSRIKKLKMVVK